MSNLKSLAFRADYDYLAPQLTTKVILFAVSAPAPNKTVAVNAVWDTGATHSVITPYVSERLSLAPIDTVYIEGVNSAGEAAISMVHIGLPNSVLITSRRVTVANIGGGADMLIGMDIITLGDFIINNANHKTSFSFGMPPFSDKPDWVERSNKINNGIV